MRINPYLAFNGQCKAAFTFYQQVLGGDNLALFTYGDSPMAEHMLPDQHDKIMHARLVVKGAVLMGGDSPEERPSETRGFCVSLGIDDATEADLIFKALSENGKIQMPIQETFWAVRFGMFIDQFGIPWMINCEKAV